MVDVGRRLVFSLAASSLLSSLGDHAYDLDGGGARGPGKYQSST